MTGQGNEADQVTADEFELPDPLSLSPELGASLDQTDIDALFGDSAVPLEGLSGVRALLQASVTDQRPMPLLEVICDRLAPAVATSLRQLSTEAMEVSLEGVTFGRFGDTMNMVPLPSVFGVFQIAPLDGEGVMVLESSLVYTLIEALMGGGTGEGHGHGVQARSFTPLETSLMSEFMKLTLQEFDRAFATAATITTQLERSEALPRFAAVAEHAAPAVQCTFRLDRDGRPGRFRIILPMAVLEPIRDKLSQRFGSDGVRPDTSWANHFERELRRTTLRLEAIVAERIMSLQDVGSLRVGQLVTLDRSPAAPVTLRLEGQPIGQAEIGQRSSRISVRLLQGLQVPA